MSRTAPCFGLLALLLLLTALPRFAHNGAVAIAVPVEGIVVDGDLSDWPAGAPLFPVPWIFKGGTLVTGDDLEAEYSIGYLPNSGRVYVGIRVRDDSVVRPARPDTTAEAGEHERAAVSLAVNLGYEAYTSGAVYGQIAGACYGVDGIPARWLMTLPLRGKIESLALGLMQVAEEGVT